MDKYDRFLARIRAVIAASARRSRNPDHEPKADGRHGSRHSAAAHGRPERARHHASGPHARTRDGKGHRR